VISADENIDFKNCATFNVPVLASDSDNVKFNLWVFDSGDYDEDENRHYDRVRTEQIEWYKETAEKLKAENGGETVKSVVFQHIIVPEIYDVLKKVDSKQPYAVKRIYNEEEFYGEFMLPSVAKNDPTCVEQDYWRGSIWPPMNYLVYEALKKQGEDSAACVLAEKSKALFLKEWLQCGHVHENYNHRTGMGCGAPKGNSEKFYNWGGLLAYIALEELKRYD
jgi:hypothetical protein